MSKIKDLINKDILKNPHLKEKYREEKVKLEVALKVMELRESQKLTQKEFALKTGKTQSVIARIESGKSNVTIQTLADLAEESGKELNITFK